MRLTATDCGSCFLAESLRAARPRQDSRKLLCDGKAGLGVGDILPHLSQGSARFGVFGLRVF